MTFTKNKNLKTILLLIWAITVLVNLGLLVNAQIDVKIYKETITNNQDNTNAVGFKYTFFSDQDTKITYIPQLSCPQAPMNLLSTEMVVLQKNSPKTLIYQGFAMDENIESQECTAYVYIVDTQQEFKQKIQVNSIQSNQNRISLQKIFKNNILNVDSNVDITNENDLFKSGRIILTDPRGTIRIIQKPGKIKFDKLGLYVVEYTEKKATSENKNTMLIAVLPKSASTIQEYQPMVNKKNNG